jgi:outer membrane protein OmpA-like peptidoglycan-associated protein
MNKRIAFVLQIPVILGLTMLIPLAGLAAETPTMAVEEAKDAIEQARKLGADRVALDDLMAAKSWLSQAEKEYAEARSLMARVSTEKTRKAKDDEIIYLANMAKLKAMVAEAKAKKTATMAKLQEEKKDLADYQNAVAVLKKKMEEAEAAKGGKAKAEAEMRDLEEARRKAAESEAQKQKELEETHRKVTEIAAQKQKELEDTRLKEAQRAAEREKELAEAKIKAEQVVAQQARESADLKAREQKLAEEREKLTALRQKTEALEREKAMVGEASKISHTTVKTLDREMVITIQAVNLFTAANELNAPGKEILNNVGKFLAAYPDPKVIIRGHTDSTGTVATNQAVSEKRAQKVREYLVAYQNVQPSRITAEGLGPTKPIATNSTEAGRVLNRRVEIAVITEEK